MIYPKLGVKIGAGKTPGIYHPVVGVLMKRRKIMLVRKRLLRRKEMIP